MGEPEALGPSTCVEVGDDLFAERVGGLAHAALFPVAVATSQRASQLLDASLANLIACIHWPTLGLG